MPRTSPDTGSRSATERASRLSLIDENRQGAALFPCTTGKDRTGWAAASRGARAECRRPADPPREVLTPAAAPDQHSTTLTARPPREVSLYFAFMSAPV
ncbi:tyrosine-protein phosphatase [Microbacterium sp. SORGH_AS_0888]|uniref:tyrosine-protein phosphatase n=1 Tax=Microbacterium sp. SORGH_AS_0888 TaxID=3041791 RepID=UPI00358F67DA